MIICVRLGNHYLPSEKYYKSIVKIHLVLTFFFRKVYIIHILTYLFDFLHSLAVFDVQIDKGFVIQIQSKLDIFFFFFQMENAEREFKQEKSFCHLLVSDRKSLMNIFVFSSNRYFFSELKTA